MITIFVLLAVGVGYTLWRNGTPSWLSFSTLSDKEALFISLPTSTSTQEEVRRHRELAGKLAEDGNEINIAGCIPDPPVLRVKRGDNITFINNSQEEVRLQIGNVGIFSVQLEDTLVERAEFGTTGEALVAYLCHSGDSSERDFGFILIQ